MSRESDAKALAKNSLLPELLDEICQGIIDEWKGEKDSDRREQLWQQHHATEELRDEINARIRRIADDTE